MIDVVLTAACRTPIGTLGGQFKSLNATDLSIPVIRELVKRGGIDSSRIDDVVWGCNYQRTFQENNLARVALVKAGLPVTVPGITVHRNCTSSMSAIQLGYYQIKAGEAGCVMAGGADSMSTAPHMAFGLRDPLKFGNVELRDSMWDSLTNLGIGPAMGITAENVAEKYGVTRQEMDEFALLSQQRAIAAQDAGRFSAEIVQVEVPGKKGCTIQTTDEYPRRDSSLEALAKLKPVFTENGTVTAGNASGMNDAASGVLLAGAREAAEWGIPVMAKIVAVATTGVEPEVMGIAPVSAITRALEKCSLTVNDIDLFEINEAFAAQCIACQKLLAIDLDRLNVNGGGISLGHPVGATGSRLVCSLVYEMKRRGSTYGVASLCAGGGMGTAVVIKMP